MANRIQNYRGTKSNMPALKVAELGFATDTRELFIGTSGGNINIGGSQWYTGTAMSETVTTTGYYSYSACPLVKVGDIYLNTSNGNVYQCTTAGSGTTAKWTYKGNIRGKGISSTAVTYQSGTSATSEPTGTWSSSIPSVAASSYLWTRVITTYTDSTTSTAYSVARQGADGSDGNDGDDGVSVVSVVQTTTSSTDGGTNVITVTLSDGTISTFNVKNGSKGSTGNTGATGNGISSVEIRYATSTSNTTAPSTWYTSVQSAAAGAYLWTRTRLYYTDGTYSDPIYSVARQGEGVIFVGTCSSPQTTAAKTVSVGSGFALTTGVHIRIKFTNYAGTAGTATLNVNNTGAKTILVSNDIEITNNNRSWVPDEIVDFIYDGTYWRATASTKNFTANGLTRNTDYSASAKFVRGLGIGDGQANGNSALAVTGSANGSACIVNGAGTESNGYQLVTGHFNKVSDGSSYSTGGDAFIIGNGASVSSLSNAFRVTYAGAVYGKAAYNSTGADYAEMFEWDDGNPLGEDRRGLFAYIVGDKIRLATAADTDRRRMGIISAFPAVVGDNFDEEWHGKYLTDIYGKPLTQTVHHDAVYNDDGECVMEECDAEELIINPDYDPDMEYVPRTQRKEYAYWSFIGKLVVRDDGTCEADGYCYPGTDGVATACTAPDKGYYVMERLDDNHIRVLVR